MENHDQSFQFYYNEASASSKPINLKLIFRDDVASPVFTGKSISRKTTAGDGENDQPIRVILVDTQTNQPVTTGPASSATVKVVLLPANFGGSTTQNGGVWTPQEFRHKIITDWGIKKNLLQGNPTVVLKDGIGTVGEIRIKHDGKPLRKDRFRLGAMVVDCADRNVVIREAVSGPFEVKDRRNEPKDSRRLLPTDKLCCLKNIGKKSPVVRCMKKKGVLTVSDFLAMLDSNPRELQEVSGLQGKRWDTVVHHAKKCRIENVHDGYGSVGSTSQQSNNTSVFYDANCYLPKPYHENDISVQDYEEGGLVLPDEEFFCFESIFTEDQTDGAPPRVSKVEEGRVVLAKKRWKKVRATLWFSLLSCLKAGLGTVGSTLAGCAG